MAGFELEAVDKIYGDGHHALRGISMSIADGEFVVLVGPSGCGKSTLLRVLAGLESVSGGEVRMDGQLINDWSPQRRNIAMVFQNYALYPHLSVRRNLEFPLRMRSTPRAERARQVARVAGMLALGPLLDKRPGQLSGGERQRVAMGRAMIREPTAFLMDEPLSNLDAKLRLQVRVEISALQRRLNTTTVYVTHDQVEALTLGDRVGVLRDGALQQFDTPMAIYESPANAFVAGFLGNPGMNLLPARVRGRSGAELVLRVGRQLWSLPGRGLAGLEADAALMAGVRPEALSVRDGPAPQTLGLGLKVVAVEALGHERLVYAELADPEDEQRRRALQACGAGAQLALRLPPGRPVAPGSLIDVGIPPAAVHLFTATGEAIPAPGRAPAAPARQAHAGH